MIFTRPTLQCISSAPTAHDACLKTCHIASMHAAATSRNLRDGAALVPITPLSTRAALSFSGISFGRVGALSANLDWAIPALRPRTAGGFHSCVVSLLAEQGDLHARGSRRSVRSSLVWVLIGPLYQDCADTSDGWLQPFYGRCSESFAVPGIAGPLRTA